MQKEWESWLLLSTLSGIGPIRLKKLIERFGSPEGVLEAGVEELLSTEGMDRRALEGLRNGGDKKRVKEMAERMERLEISLVTIMDKEYPENLKPLENMPPYLFVKGSLLPSDQRAVAIVGSRKATHYGRGIAREFSIELARRGITVVSGLARGIDTSAHDGALEGEGRTLAVLGCGVDMIYPPENRPLRDRIIQRGAVLSEYPLGTEPFSGNFPQRNRLISGLSLGVVCVEASGESGVFSTVRWALDQGRDVFAVPGDVKKKTSIGTNRLIRDGAKLVVGIEDILEELNLQDEPRSSIQKMIPELNDEEGKIFNLLSSAPLHIDEISEGISISSPKALSLLLSLELKGLVRQLPGKTFIRSEPS